jgi:Na+-transporting NADH:ubiquinone oxidoreductase subunit C
MISSDTLKSEEKKLMKHTNIYSLIFSFVIASVCGAILLGTHKLLIKKVSLNQRIEKISSLMKIAGIDLNNINKKELEKIFKTNFTREKLTENSFRYKYILNTKIKSYIYPLDGNGLWGPIHGYIAMEPDLLIVKGIIFTHQEETPGLGAEIAHKNFYSKFIGLKITENAQSNKIVLHVKKSGTKNSPNEVDGITGATETIKGVEKMVNKTIKIIILSRGKK